MTGGGTVGAAMTPMSPPGCRCSPSAWADLEPRASPPPCTPYTDNSFLDSMEAFEKLWAVAPNGGMKIDRQPQSAQSEYLTFCATNAG